MRIHLTDPYFIEDLTPMKDAFAFTPHRGWRWLQRACCWIMNRLQAHAMRVSRTMHYYTVDVDFDQLADVLVKHCAGIETVFQQRPRYVVMGRNEMVRWLNAPALRTFSFSFPPDYRAGLARQARVFAGLKVVCIPWIEGMFVLPDLERVQV